MSEIEGKIVVKKSVIKGTTFLITVNRSNGSLLELLGVPKRPAFIVECDESPYIKSVSKSRGLLSFFLGGDMEFVDGAGKRIASLEGGILKGREREICMNLGWKEYPYYSYSSPGLGFEIDMNKNVMHFEVEESFLKFALVACLKSYSILELQSSPG